MKLRTYRAASMADALAQVKKDLGRDAVILHTRTAKVGGIMGFFARTVIEVTASDQVGVGRAGAGNGVSQAQSSVAQRGALKPERRETPPSKPTSEGTGALIGTIVEAYRRAGAVLPPTPQPVQPAITPPAAEERATETAVMPVRQKRTDRAPVGAAAITTVPPDALRRELADIKRMVTQVLRTSGGAGAAGGGGVAGGGSDALFNHYLKLLEAEVSRDIADEVIGAVRDELNAGELADAEIVRAAVLRRLSGMIPVAEDVAAPSKPADGRPLTLALVGPTGVGKTTTTAKLAAAYRLRHGRSVGLITTDTYRIAAVDQLRTYAQIIGIPLRVVLTAAEIPAALDSLADCDVVLIDTAGRSQNADERLEELSSYLDAARPHEVHLVLSAAASESVLARTVSAFARLSPNRVLLTKLDEAVNFGVVVNVAARLRELGLGAGGQRVPLSFVTTGQEVPDDIEPGRSDRLARMVLDNSLRLSAGTRASEPGRQQHDPCPRERALPITAGVSA